MTQKDELVTVHTPVCPHCNRGGHVQITRAELDAWRGGMLIQKAMPTRSVELREQLITGFHPECWAVIMPPEEEDKVPC